MKKAPPLGTFDKLGFYTYGAARKVSRELDRGEGEWISDLNFCWKNKTTNRRRSVRRFVKTMGGGRDETPWWILFFGRQKGPRRASSRFGLNRILPMLNASPANSRFVFLPIFNCRGGGGYKKEEFMFRDSLISWFRRNFFCLSVYRTPGSFNWEGLFENNHDGKKNLFFFFKPSIWILTVKKFKVTI